jgi:hypothetical protein
LERLRQFLGADNAAVDDLAKRPRTIPDDSAGSDHELGHLFAQHRFDWIPEKRCDCPDLS